MTNIKNVKLFCNNNIKSKKTAKIIEEALINNNFNIVEDDFDLGIAVGGDGSFLRMIKTSNFNSDVYYVGINAGTLGFAQDVSVLEINEFISDISKNNFTYEEIGVQEVEVITRTSNSKFYSLNEIVVRDEELNTAGFDVLIDNDLLEKYVGDGLLISTSFGSTAYNLSFGGSVVYNTFNTLQITPIAPLNNKSYRNLLNSLIIPSDKLITLVPTRNNGNVVLTVDGDNNFYNSVLKINTIINNKSIKLIRKKDYNFILKINSKFLK
jgi:NAD+ kinase